MHMDVLEHAHIRVRMRKHTCISASSQLQGSSVAGLTSAGWVQIQEDLGPRC